MIICVNAKLFLCHMLSGFLLLMFHCRHSAAAAPVNMEGSHSLHTFINSYQMMFFTLFALLAGTAIIIIGRLHISVEKL